ARFGLQLLDVYARAGARDARRTLRAADVGDARRRRRQRARAALERLLRVHDSAALARLAERGLSRLRADALGLRLERLYAGGVELHLRRRDSVEARALHQLFQRAERRRDLLRRLARRLSRDQAAADSGPFAADALHALRPLPARGLLRAVQSLPRSP